MRTGEMTSGRILAKKAAAADFAGGIVAFRIAKLKAGDITNVQYAGAGERREYGRFIADAALLDLTDGITLRDIEKLEQENEVTLIAGEALATVLTPLEIGANGKVVAMTANPTPSDQYCFAETLEVAAADGSEILCRIIKRMISY